MTTTSTEPTTEPAAGTTLPAPRCQALLECAEQCCPPTPCGRPAVARVSFRCAGNGCDHASDLLLLCTVCTSQADAIGHVLARRPL